MRTLCCWMRRQHCQALPRDLPHIAQQSTLLTSDFPYTRSSSTSATVRLLCLSCCAASDPPPGLIPRPSPPAPHPQDETNTPIKQDVKKGKLRFYPYNINWNYGLLP